MKKAIGTLMVCLAVVTLAAVGNELFGNPISKHQAEEAILDYLEQTYPGRDFVLTEVRHDSKTGDYKGTVQSPSSIDTHFTVAVTDGAVRFDTYDSNVLGKFNTFQRLEAQYRDLAEPVLKLLQLDYTDREAGVSPLKTLRSFLDLSLANPPLAMEDLELDREYDITALGAQAGVLAVRAEVAEATEDAAWQILTDVRAVMDKGGVPFRAVDLSLSTPDGQHLRMENVLYEQIG